MAEIGHGASGQYDFFFLFFFFFNKKNLELGIYIFFTDFCFWGPPPPLLVAEAETVSLFFECLFDRFTG